MRVKLYTDDSWNKANANHFVVYIDKERVDIDKRTEIVNE